MLEIQNYDSIEEYLKKLSEEIVNYINENKRMPVYYINNIGSEELKKMRMLYVKKMIFFSELQMFGYIDMFDEVYNSVQMELVKLNKTRVLKKLIEFLKEHNGDMPSLNLVTDRELALNVNKIKDILDDEDVMLKRLEYNKTSLANASNRLKNDKNFILKAIKIYDKSLKYASKKIKQELNNK